MPLTNLPPKCNKFQAVPLNFFRFAIRDSIYWGWAGRPRFQKRSTNLRCSCEGGLPCFFGVLERHILANMEVPTHVDFTLPLHKANHGSVQLREANYFNFIQHRKSNSNFTVERCTHQFLAKVKYCKWASDKVGWGTSRNPCTSLVWTIVRFLGRLPYQE